MATLVTGVMDGNLPWALMVFGAVLALVAEACGVIPLAFAIGLYLPITTTAPLILGGLLRCGRRARRCSARRSSDPSLPRGFDRWRRASWGSASPPFTVSGLPPTRSRSARPGRPATRSKRCFTILPFAALTGVLAARSARDTTALMNVAAFGRRCTSPATRRRSSAHYRWNVGAAPPVRAPRHHRLAPDHRPDVRAGLPLSTRRLEPRGRCAALRRWFRALRLTARRRSRVAHQPLVKRTAIRIGTRHAAAGPRHGARRPRTSRPHEPRRFRDLLLRVQRAERSPGGRLRSLLMAKVIPLGRRGRFIGARDFAGGATAALVAWIAASWLADVLFPRATVSPISSPSSSRRSA